MMTVCNTETTLLWIIVNTNTNQARVDACFFKFYRSPCINLQLNGKGMRIGIDDVRFLSSLWVSGDLKFRAGFQRWD